MSKKRMFDTKFWSDGFVVDELNPLDRLLYLYLLLNAHTNLIGIYELSVRTAAFETGIDRDGLEKMLVRLSPKIEYIDGWIYIRRFADYQLNNPNITTGMEREVAALPETLRSKIVENGIISERLAKAFNNYRKPSKAFQSVRDTNTNTNTNTNLGNTNVLPYVQPAEPSALAKRTITKKELITKLNSAVHGSDQITITKGRIDKLGARLKTFSAQQMLDAAELVGADAYLQGDNDAGKRYGTIDYLLRNDEIVAKYLELDASERDNTKPPSKEELEKAYKNL